MAIAFLQPGLNVNLLLLLHIIDQNQNFQNARVSTYPNVQQGSDNQQMSLSRWGDAWKKLPFFAALCQQFSKSHCFPAEH